MWMFGLLLVGLAAGGLISSDDDDGISEERVERDGEEGLLREGNDEDNSISGTSGPDLLSGEEGDDRLSGGNGRDALLGGEGDDTLSGGEGDDILYGGEGDDLLNGGANEDTLRGYTGNDTLNGGAGNDVLIGVDLSNRDVEVGDLYTGRESPGDLVREAPTADEANVLNGGSGYDQLLLGEGDTATGGEGRDTFQVGEWVEENAPLITDFNADEDVLSILYENGQPSPTITIERSDDETQVLANSIVVARITGDAAGLDASDVILTRTF